MTVAPYEPCSTDGWIKAVAERFAWQELDEDLLLWGDCPRCGHGIYKLVHVHRELVLPGPQEGALERAVSRATRDEVVRCNCAAVHEGAGPGASGCGAAGVLTLELSPPKVVATRRASAFDVYWEEQAEQLGRDALTSTRRAAGQWAATVGTLTGIFSIAALITGRSNVSDLAHGYSVAVGIVVALALLAAVTAVTFAALAAQGTPVSVELTGNGIRKLIHDETASAARKLRWSRVCAIVAVFLIAVGIGLMWYGPAASG
jgi:hypothetical protein